MQVQKRREWQASFRGGLEGLSGGLDLSGGLGGGRRAVITEVQGSRASSVVGREHIFRYTGLPR